jgi:hypothetical protein
MLELVAGDYVQLMWRTSDINLELTHEAASTSPTRPAVPSAIVTAHQVMYTQLGPTGPTGAPSTIAGPTGPTGSTGKGFSGLSTTTGLTCGTLGTVSLTTNVSVSTTAFQVGQDVTILSQADPLVFYASGYIYSISGSTLVVAIYLWSVSDGVVRSNWNIALSGQPGASGPTGPTGSTGSFGPTGPTGASSGGLSYIFTTTAVTATNNQGVLTSTSGGSFTVTLPAAPSVGNQVVIADAGSSWATNNLTVDRNGSTLVAWLKTLYAIFQGSVSSFCMTGQHGKSTLKLAVKAALR